jgi:hypothetical protein
MGFVIEAIRKIVSRSIGSLASTSRQPTETCWTTLLPRQASVAAPASAPVSTMAPSALAISSSPAANSSLPGLEYGIARATYSIR